MEFPEDLKYSKEHEWLRIEGDSAVMGITAFAQSELGEVVFVDLPPVGKTLERSQTACVVESTKAASDVYAPIGGSVKEVNLKLQEKPDLVNTSPYQDGWMIRLEQLQIAESDALMSASEYRAYLGNKI